MEVINYFLSIVEFAIVSIILYKVSNSAAFPLYTVFESTVFSLRVQYIVNFVLLFPINNYRRSRWLYVSRQ